MPSAQPIPFDNSYARLPEQFYTRLAPTPVAEPRSIRVNTELARELGIDAGWLAGPEGTAVIAGNAVPDGADPLAAVYAGHQFGSYNPQLGDGRALLLGEVVTADGRRFDVQLKGSGRTPYSRGGDGRSPLGPVLREYLVSESMHALGVPTTRALAAVATGEPVYRDQVLPGAVLARVASSHIRIGTFQFFAARQDEDSLRLLAEHVISRHYPRAAEADNPVHALLQAVVSTQARLVAQWQLLGFIHGVMNTDNMLLCGETIDYGPCAFMDDFHPETVFSSIDHGGRYAFRNQPGIAHWNLACLAQALLPVLHPDAEKAVALAQAAVDAYPAEFQLAHSAGLARKLGLAELREEDTDLVEDLFRLMAAQGADFTLTFRHLADLVTPPEAGEADVTDLYQAPGELAFWVARWRRRLEQETTAPEQRQQAMLRSNPVFIARNHLVAEAIEAAENGDDFEPFHTLCEILSAPFSYRPEHARYALPPRPEQVVHKTFCGT